MRDQIQIIKRDGKPEWAVLPYKDCLQLVEQAELLEDIMDFDRIGAAIERGDEELIPAEVVIAILDGQHPSKVWREYRGLTQQQLADAIGISKTYLCQMETGKRSGKASVLSAIGKSPKLVKGNLWQRIRVALLNHNSPSDSKGKKRLMWISRFNTTHAIFCFL